MSPESAANPRGANALYVMPHSWASALHFLTPLVDLAQPAGGPQVLILTADADAAASTAAAAARLCQDRNLNVVAATSPDRAARLVQTLPAQLVVGSPDMILALMRRGALKLDALRGIAIAWANEVLANTDEDAIASIMTDVPKEAARAIVTAVLSPEIESLAERYAWRARRFVEEPGSAAEPLRIQYVTTSVHGRLPAIRRVLDALDPKAALIHVHPDNESEVQSALRGSGISAGGSAIRVGRTAEETDDLTILFDLPASNESLREAVGPAREVVALIQPRQLTSLRAIAGGGTVQPLTLPEPGQRARDDAAKLRDELRRELESSQIGKELLALEPLLDDYDGSEVAAAALKLLDRARRAKAPAPVAPPPREASTGVALFVNAGSRDGITERDLSSAIATATRLPAGQLGPITVRESHSIVEVPTAAAESVIEKLTGVTLRGRRLVARRERPRPPRDGSERARPPRDGNARPRRPDRRPRTRE